MSDLQQTLLHSKPVRILLGLMRGTRPKYASVLSREANCTYSHTVKILNIMKEHEVVNFEKDGRKKLIKLTDQGRDLVASLERLLVKIDHIK